MKQVLPRELVWETGINVYDNFFPVDLLCELSHDTLTQPERKVQYDTLDGSLFPEPFDKAARHVVDNIPTCINTVVSKRYETDGGSSAFDLHYDPEEYEDLLILCSLGGLSTLTVIDLNVGMFDIRCTTNRVVTLPAYGIPKIHRISPPLEAAGVRPFVFFGHQDPDFDHQSGQSNAMSLDFLNGQ